jgi:hypothetical protein
VEVVVAHSISLHGTSAHSHRHWASIQNKPAV